MRAIHRIIGCTLCLAFAGSAAATSLDSQDVDTGTRTAASHTSHDSEDCIAGDIVGTNRGNSGNSGSTGNGGASRSNNDRSGAASSAPATVAPRPHLGWQSLLPGSIQ